MSKLAQILRVISRSDERKDKLDRTYVNLRVEAREYVHAVNPETGETMVLKGDRKVSGTNQWETNINGDEDPFWDLQVGGYLPGALITRFVEPYTIPQDDGRFRRTNIATVLVIGDSTAEDWLTKIALAFGRRGFALAANQNQAVESYIVDEPIGKVQPQAAFDKGADGADDKDENAKKKVEDDAKKS
jgi:hypothetical protein